MNNYEPFGMEWELEMMEMRKQNLVEMLRAALKENIELKENNSLENSKINS